MVARWISVLESYNFIIEDRKGSQHTNADALSRKPNRFCKREDCPGCDKNVHKITVSPVVIWKVTQNKMKLYPMQMSLKFMKT